MKEGSIVLAPVPQADGRTKTRPVLLLREMPHYGDYLVCGISSQLHQCITGFDETIGSSDEDFKQSGLVTESVIRLGFLGILQRKHIAGAIGSIATERHERLLQNLADYLLSIHSKIS